MKKSLHAVLTLIGVQWIDHQRDEYASFGHLMRECHNQTLAIGDKIISVGICQRMAINNQDASIYKTAIYEYVQSSIRLPLELIFASRTYAKMHGLQGLVCLWMPNTFVTRLLSNQHSDITNLCPRWWIVIEFMTKLAVKLTSYVLRKIGALLKRYVTLVLCCWKQRQSELTTDLKSGRASGDMYGCAVAFFPHQGVLYGDMYVKDHFYSKVEGDEFSPANIIHLELEANLNSAAVDYYTKNNFRFLYWSNVRINTRLCAKSVGKFIIRLLEKPVDCLDLDLLLKTSRFVWMVDSAVHKLGKFYNLKVVLVGYDILFPQWLSVACRIAGVKTIAAQERMISAWWFHPLLFDLYLTMGPESTARLKSYETVGCSYHEIGPVRLSKYANVDLSQVRTEIECMEVRYDAIVLAMDMHSDIGVIENGRALGNNWRINARFYVDLLKLSENFPEFLFLLKGKDINFTKVSYLSELSEKMLSRKNIKILDDSSLWTPFSSVAIADIGFARHTSMADEMLALGKPVIFHDTYGFPSQVFDYGREVTLHTYDQYVNAFKAFKNDRSAFNERYRVLRRRLFVEGNNTKLDIQNILHSQL
jgi:hypothetical protein